jgi:hypothetical protein
MSNEPLNKGVVWVTRLFILIAAVLIAVAILI